MRYRLVIVGHPPRGGRLAASRFSVEMFSVLLLEAFSARGIDATLVDATCLTRDQVEADAVVVHTYRDVFDSVVYPVIRRIDAVTMSFMEVPYPTDLRMVFYPFAGQGRRDHVVTAPVDLSRLPVVDKTPRTVLLDHAWDTPAVPDWSDRILAAVEPLVPRYSISRIAGGQCRRSRGVRVIPHYPYPRYLHATSRFETFVVTHRGSYNASAIDMLARGTRVISPRGFLPRHNVRHFRIPEFDDTAQMLDLITQPFDAGDWLRRRAACTDLDQAVALMDRLLRNEIRRRGLTRGRRRRAPLRT